LDEYPTEENLKIIEEWNGKNIEAFLAYIESLWHWPDFGFKRKGGKVIRLELHTGGWSGNEDIIEALHKAWSGIFWTMYWMKSTKGGHYWFRIPLKSKKIGLRNEVLKGIENDHQGISGKHYCDCSGGISGIHGILLF
jgi:hypothetical protein